MKNTNKKLIFLVDDDVLYLELLLLEFQENSDFILETFVTGEACIENLYKNPDVIILDYILDSNDKKAANGLQILDKIKEIKPRTSVIILSAQDSIEVAVNCIHHKATDYVVKSETSFIRLRSIITSALQYKKMEDQLSWYMTKM